MIDRIVIFAALNKNINFKYYNKHLYFIAKHHGFITRKVSRID